MPETKCFIFIGTEGVTFLLSHSMAFEHFIFNIKKNPQTQTQTQTLTCASSKIPSRLKF